ncbi:MAG TPA: chromosomal replication initiator protein DnaA, partial [Candidatus Faecisoma merdavium]|nr:chromosomal replication initiator protein DnaA [Candidatus Faecisoma merdavium]
AKILVPMPVHKKHLKENYIDLIEKIFTDVTGSIFKFEFITEDEIKNDTVIDVDEIGVPESAIFQTNLDPKYTFESFVSGNSNKFAKASALAVAEQPGSMYNPLFIYGKSGLGKTHLMHAIGNYIKENSRKRVLYVTTETFVNDFLKIYRKDNNNNFDNIDSFKEKYRNVDVLMIDDIQYLEIAIKTQQEFFNTFNDLYTNNKQIIIASDRSPDDLKKLEERLRTRFVWGLIVNILPPDYQLRIDIIDRKIDGNNLNTFFPQDVKEYIANNCTTDIRKLEGAITRTIAYAAIMNGSDITLDLAVDALKDYFSGGVLSKNKIEQVQQIIANNYNINIDDLKGKRKSNDIAIPRQIAMYICRIYLKESLPKIGAEFGGKDHTTVMHAVNKIKKELEKNDELNIEINKIISQIPWINQ